MYTSIRGLLLGTRSGSSARCYGQCKFTGQDTNRLEIKRVIYL